MIDISIIFLNLCVCALFVIDTYSISEEARSVLWKVEVVIVCFFIAEYVVRLYSANDRVKQLRDIYSIIDLIAILPTLSLLILPVFGMTLQIGIVKLIRVFRVFRIFRFLRFTADPIFFFGNLTSHLLNVVRLLLTIFIIFFISSGFFYYVENGFNDQVKNFGDAFYFTVVSLTTVGFGDIIPYTEAGRWVTVAMVLSGIILLPWQASRIIKEWVRIGSKKKVVCPDCGLRYHEKDASHCKSCGRVIYQEYDGD
jgi:voltage-gated potassium channel